MIGDHHRRVTVLPSDDDRVALVLLGLATGNPPELRQLTNTAEEKSIEIEVLHVFALNIIPVGQDVPLWCDGSDVTSLSDVAA